MATSRGATPADPVLQATTDDNSRGGLFTRSNIANPVEGVDVAGVTINDSTITIDINGSTQSFMLNQANDQTLSFTVEGGSSGPITGNINLREGELSPDGNTLILTLSDNTMVNVDVARLNVDTQLSNAQVRTIVDGFDNIVRTVNGVAPVNGNVTISGSGNTFADSDTVDFTVNPTTNEVTAQAMVQVGNGTVDTTTVTAADSIIVDPATGFQVAQVGSSDVWVFQRIPVTPPPAPAAPPSFTTPAPTSALNPAPEEVITFTAPTGNTITNIDMVTVNDQDGTLVPGVTTDTTSITIPAGGANAPGMYDISARVTTMNDASGETRMTTEMPELVRYIPFFQSRNPITDVTASGVVASTEAWTNTVTAIAGSGSLYIAALSTELPTSRTVANQGPFQVFRLQPQTAVSVTLADSTTRTFNVFRILASAGVEITNFRDTR